MIWNTVVTKGFHAIFFSYRTNYHFLWIWHSKHLSMKFLLKSHNVISSTSISMLQPVIKNTYYRQAFGRSRNRIFMCDLKALNTNVNFQSTKKMLIWCEAVKWKKIVKCYFIMKFDYRSHFTHWKPCKLISWYVQRL